MLQEIGTAGDRSRTWGPDGEYAPGWVVLARARFNGGDAEAVYLEHVGRGPEGAGPARPRAKERR